MNIPSILRFCLLHIPLPRKFVKRFIHDYTKVLPKYSYLVKWFEWFIFIFAYKLQNSSWTNIRLSNQNLCQLWLCIIEPKILNL